MPAQTPAPSPRTLRLRQYRIRRASALREGQELDATGAALHVDVVHREGVIVDIQYHLDFTKALDPPHDPDPLPTFPYGNDGSGRSRSGRDDVAE